MEATFFSPAKVNLALHVTGRRTDGYHELDSLVMFADIGDRVRASPAPKTSLKVTGPMAGYLPENAENMALKAAQLTDVPAKITLEKNLPVSAGLGGGSGNVAATWAALEALKGTPIDAGIEKLGADVPVCRVGRTARMQGIGDKVAPIDGLPVLDVVLVNPNLPVMTAEVFRNLEYHSNTPMPADIPHGMGASEFTEWLGEMRNDLEPPAMKLEPVIEMVFSTLSVTPGCLLTRMSGSGGTCFAIYQDAETAASAAGRMAEAHPNWWITPAKLNATI